MNVIDQSPNTAKAKILSKALNPIRTFLPTASVERCCHGAGYYWRERRWTPVVTLLACIWKHLHAVSSARAMEDWIASLDGDNGSISDGRDFCRARSRLPLPVFHQAVSLVGEAASKRAGIFFRGLRVCMIDGTTLRTPNSKENGLEFGRSRNASRCSRTPLVRLCLFICAGSGAVLASAAGSYLCSEWRLFLKMLITIPAQTLLVGDRAYSSYLAVALVRSRGSHVLVRRHAWRRDQRIGKLGEHDEIHEWPAPAAAGLANPELLAQAPRALKVRVITRKIERKGFRSWELKLVTTLMDPMEFPADELVQQYMHRWDIELSLRTLKSDYGMARLSGKTPDIVYKEICSTFLAYNCVVATMAESGERPRGLSHLQARALLLEYASRMVCAPTVQLPLIYRELLKIVARATIKKQNRPSEPRAIIQHRNPYRVLTLSRQAWRRRHRVA